MRKYSYRYEDTTVVNIMSTYTGVRGADKSLARPGRKQANVSVRMAWISFGALPCRKKKLDNRSRLDVVEIAHVAWHVSELVSFLVGLRTYQHPGTLLQVLNLHCKKSSWLLWFYVNTEGSHNVCTQWLYPLWLTLAWRWFCKNRNM